MDKPIQRAMNAMTGPAGPRPQMMAPPMMAGGPGAAAMTPKEIVGILRRHILMIIIFTVMGTIIGGGSWFLLNRYAPKYTAKTGIRVSQPGLKDPRQVSNPQVQKDLYYQHRFTMASSIKMQSMLEKLIREASIRELDWFKQFGKLNAQGEIVGDKDKAVLKAFEDLEDNLGASAPRDQNFILVSMRTGSAGESKIIVDEMVRLFIEEQKQLALGDVTGKLSEMKRQRDAIQTRLNQIEASLDAIRSGTRFARLNLGENQSFRDYMDQKISDLERNRSLLESSKSRLQSTIATLDARAKAVDPDERLQEQVEIDRTAQQMRAQIAVLEPRLGQLRARFGDEHRAVKDAEASLKEAREKLAYRQDEIGNIIKQSNLIAAQEEMTAHIQQLETTTRDLQAAQAEYKEVDRIRSEYSRYNDQRDEQMALLEEMNKQIEVLNAVYSDPDLSTLKSMGPAPKPLRKSFPNIKLFVPGGFMLGLLAGLGIAFLIEMSNDLLRTPSDVARHVKSPLMGMVCHVNDDEDVEGIDLYHVVRQAPYSIMSECYRQLRTNLRLSGPGGKTHQTLFITSGQAGDGKTTVSINMASTLLAENRKVLLIDGNFRRPSTTRLFPRATANGTPAEFADYGLSNYLMGQCSDETQIIRPSGIENLSIIDSGPLPANPAELLAGGRMKALLDQCKERFDYVVIDGPATLVSDSKILATQADGTIVVFNAETTHRGAAMRILREMRDIHANVIGTILMGVKSRKGGYFNEIYQSYQDYQRVHVEQPV